METKRDTNNPKQCHKCQYYLIDTAPPLPPSNRYCIHCNIYKFTIYCIYKEDNAQLGNV